MYPSKKSMNDKDAPRPGGSTTNCNVVTSVQEDIHVMSIMTFLHILQNIRSKTDTLIKDLQINEERIPAYETDEEGKLSNRSPPSRLNERAYTGVEVDQSERVEEYAGALIPNICFMETNTDLGDVNIVPSGSQLPAQTPGDLESADHMHERRSRAEDETTRCTDSQSLTFENSSPQTIVSMGSDYVSAIDAELSEIVQKCLTPMKQQNRTSNITPCTERLFVDIQTHEHIADKTSEAAECQATCIPVNITFKHDDLKEEGQENQTIPVPKNKRMPLEDLDKRKNPVRAKAPEDTLRIINAPGSLSLKDRIDQIEDFCAQLLDHIKLNRCPSGVVLDRSEVRPGFAKKYQEGKEYSITPTVLGKGLHGKIYVTLDKGTKKSHAIKEVPINFFRSDEIRAMAALQDSGITPKLFLCQLSQNNVQLIMEIVDNSVTIVDLVSEQLACIVSRESDVENLPRNIHQFALYVCTETFKAVRHLHQLGWFHKDLHGGNVLLQFVHEGEVRIRILDSGSAVYISLRENETPPLLDDVTNLLRQFASLYLVGDWFDNISDFKRYYVGRITGSQLGEEQKAFLISIIKNGLEVKNVQQEKEFISGLENKLQQCSKISVQRVVDLLKFEHTAVFQPEIVGESAGAPISNICSMETSAYIGDIACVPSGSQLPGEPPQTVALSTAKDHVYGDVPVMKIKLKTRSM